MRILFVSVNAPYPTSNGGHQRTHLLHTALSLCGQVSLLVLDSPGNFTAAEHEHMALHYGLLDMAPLSMARPAGLLGQIDPKRWPRLGRLAHNIDGSHSRFHPDPGLLSRLSGPLGRVEEFDLIVGRYTRSLARTGLLGRGRPMLLDIDDLDSDTYKSRAAAAPTVLSRHILARHQRNIARQQARVFERIDRLWVSNPGNLADLADAVAQRCSVLPNIPFVPANEPPNRVPVPDGSRRIMTIGSYRHAANVDGVNRFLRDTWPRVKAEVPDARFTIYGSGLSDAQRARWQGIAGVEAIGFVERVADAYADCAVAVCPVVSGAGTNIKVLEAGAHLRQCVLTRTAARGFERDAGLQSVLNVADDAADMAQRIIRLLRDLPQARAEGEAFHAAVAAGFSADAFNRIVARDVQATMSR